MRRSIVVVSLSFVCAAYILASPAVGHTQSSNSNRQSASSDTPNNEVKNYTLPPDKYEKAVAYSRTQYALHFIGVAYSLLVLLVILSLRIAPIFRDWAERVSHRRFVQAVVFVPLLLLTCDALALPLAAYNHHLDVRYDISVQSWGSWFWDWSKGEIIQFIIASILAYILYAVIRRSRRRWWLYFGLASLPIMVFLLLIAPVAIDPLFNHFEPLDRTQPALIIEIEKVLKQGGLDIPHDRIFEMKASEKSNAINAYVTGVGASKRVVVWDTTISKMTPPQTVFVVGHEMGHYMLDHIPKGIAFAGALIIVVLMLVHLTLRRALDRRQWRWSLRGLDDWASLPALLLFTYLFFFLAEPVFNTFSRYQEHQADIYGLEITHGIVPDSHEAAAEAFQIMGEADLADPHPSTFIKIWLYSHPPLEERIRFANEYDPWSKGQSPMFVR